MRLLSDGGYSIHADLAIEGEGIQDFVFARGWLLEIIELKRGEYAFYSNGQKVEPNRKRFGVFYPAFTIVRPYVRQVSATVTGVGSVKTFHELPDHPILFDTDFEGELTSVEQGLEVLAIACDRRPIEVNTRPTPLSASAKQLIDENYLAPLSIADMARSLGFSHEYMSRKFKRDYGMSPRRYLHQLRVTDATLRLSLGQEIIDISMDVGYNDLGRFYKQFKNATHTSPGECREFLKQRGR